MGPLKTDQNSKLAVRNELFKGLKAMVIVVCLVLSLTSVAFCFFLNFKASELQDRVTLLENEKGRFNMPASAATFLSEDGTMPLFLQNKLDRLLQERLEEHLGKRRIVREAQANCNCPPGL
ncbi:collagen alpha-1(XXV) chain-like [Protopterus annectens]|uniref:collagen alpha-1(XXV) chain-like n=1 Tax=Protopterus annectens TaxID=7888 RepID=UPI001CFA3A07|nr:collagen alpha-1(XXV) chain-like [Protopterus annectens]